MFSKEFMRYLIQYQGKDESSSKKESSCQVKYFKMGLKNRIAATVMLTCNR